MSVDFIPYRPPQFISHEWKRRRYAVSLPRNHIPTSNSAEDFDDIWSSQRTEKTIKEITDETLCIANPDSPDGLWKASQLPNSNINARPSVPITFNSIDYKPFPNPNVQTESDTKGSGKTQSYAIIIDEDLNLDQNINTSTSLQSLDATFLAPVNANADELTSIVKKDADDQLSATEELLHAQVESDPAPIPCETADIPTDSCIEALCLDSATKMSVEMTSVENSDGEAQNESANTSPAQVDPPPSPPPPPTPPTPTPPPTPPTPTPPPLPPVTDEMPEDEWEAIGIIGEEMINGKLHYIVDWKPTPVPKEDCVNMGKLVDEWEKSKTRGRKGGKRIKRPAAELVQDPPRPPPLADVMSEDEWEALEIIGEEIINGKLHYIVDWKPTPVPKEDCVNMGKLVDEWEKSKTHGRKGGKRKNNNKVSTKRLRGRPRKATQSHEQGKKSNNKDSTKRPRGRPRKA